MNDENALPSTPGNDVIEGTVQSDVLSGGLGNDTLNGLDGGDRYLFSAGDGQDIIDDNGFGDSDRLIITGYLPAEATLLPATPDSPNLVITFANSSDRIEIVNTLAGDSADTIEVIEWDDGTTWNRLTYAGIARSTLLSAQATSGDDTIEGTSQADTLQGGLGNDTLIGGDASDLYLYASGDGRDVIDDNGFGDRDRLEISGYGPNDATLLPAGVDGADLLIQFTNAGDSITIVNTLLGTAQDTIEEIAFEDGTIWTRTQYLALARASGLNAQATSGDDQITGTAEADRLAGGRGNDTINGLDGSDTYIYAAGDGADTIEDNGFGDRDRLEISGYTPTQVTVQVANADATDLALIFPNQLDSIIIINTLTGDTADTIEEIAFDDGTVWTRDVYVSLALAEEPPNPLATDGNDVLTGSPLADTLDAGPGNDTINGLDGSDIYIYEAGDGADIIEDNGYLDTDRIVISGYTAAQAVLRPAAQNSTDLIIDFPAAGDSITVINTLNGSVFDGIEEIAFADGTVWTREVYEALARATVVSAQVTSGNDIIRGTTRDDTIFGSLGDDVLNGLDGSDTYLFSAGDGVDIIEDNGYADTDRLQISGYTPDQAILTIGGANNTDLVIEFAGGNDEIRIVNTVNGNVFDTIEEIAFDNGTVWTRAQYVALARDARASQSQSDGNDVIQGTDQNDILAGGRGNDTLNGLDGSDTYRFVAGDGQDTIEDNGFADRDRLEISGYTPGQAVLSIAGTNNTDLVLSFNGGADQITIINTLNSSVFDSIEEIAFDDGTVWTRAEYTTMALMAAVASQATSGNDIITGTSQAETLAGGLGNDTLSGLDGSDTYVFAAGDGQDVIEDNGYLDTDRLEISGHLSSAARLLPASQGSPDLVITFANSSDQITIRNTLTADVYDSIEQIAFADGTVWSRAEFTSIALANAVSSGATNGDDTITGTPQADTLAGGLGNDTLNGLDGSDTYVFAAGDGQDTIEDNGFGDSDVLSISGHASSAAILNPVSPGSPDLLITFANSNDQITIINTLNGDINDTIERISFADGIVWNRAQYAAIALGNAVNSQATTGDDTITGTPQADTLAGGLGNDTLNGLDGSDTYVYAAGDGADTIDDNGFGDTDRLTISGYASTVATLLPASAGSPDLVITFPTNTDQITIVNTLTGNINDTIEEIAFADGVVLTRTQYAALANANASNIPPATNGNDTITGTSQPDVLSGGLGNDTLSGGDGSDDYLFAIGDGQDTIEDNGFGDTDRLILTGINQADVTLLPAAPDSQDLLITFPSNAGNQITIVNTLTNNPADTIEQIVFADGTILTRAEYAAIALANSVSSQATTGDDTIVGTNGPDTLAGGLGDDTVSGRDGSDTYLFTRGDGKDTIDDNGFGDTDRLNISGYTPAQTILAPAAPDSPDLVITFLASMDEITIINTLTGNTIDAIEQIAFDDGTVWNRSQYTTIAQSTPAPALPATTGNDVITGTPGADTLNGGLGNDTLSGRDGSDAYFYTFGGGQDIIDENGFGDTDRLTLLSLFPEFGQGVISPQTTVLRPASATSSDLVITFTNRPNDSITVLNTLSNNIVDSIEEIVFPDGTVLTQAQYTAAALTGFVTDQITTGADTVTGTPSADSINGLAGNDTLNGGDGSDTYTFTQGGGQDIIEDNGNGDVDRLVFSDIPWTAAKLLPASVNSPDLVITFTGLTEQVTVKNTLNNNRFDAIEEIEFRDGVILTQQQYTNQALAQFITDQQTDGNDNILGTTQADRIAGGRGTDSLTGGDGSDTYIWNAGDGLDIITDGGFGDTDRIEINGFLSSQATFNSNSLGDLVITFDTSDPDAIVVANGLNNSVFDTIEEIVFSDRTYTVDEYSALV
ncbi:MAG: calcium-binding protein [Pseudomonadota bacterium]